MTAMNRCLSALTVSALLASSCSSGSSNKSAPTTQTATAVTTATSTSEAAASPPPVPESRQRELHDREKPFFAAVAGQHELTAIDVNGSKDTTWTHGKKYTVEVTSDGRVTLPTDGHPFAWYHGDPRDWLIVAEPTSYLRIERDAGKLVLVQDATGGKRLLLTFSLARDPKKIIWRFDDKGITQADGTMVELGLMHAIGSFAGEIDFTDALDPANLAKGTKVTIAIDPAGNVTSTFGDFAYSKDTVVVVPHSDNVGIGDSGPKKFARWSKPSHEVCPREELTFDFYDDGRWSGVTYLRCPGTDPTVLETFTAHP